MAQGEKKGLGGWLILVGLGVVITPVKLLYNFIPVFVPIFTDGTWEALTNEESESYHPLFKSLLLGELTFNLCLVIATIYLIYLFFTRHYRFPVIYIAVLAVSIAVIPLDAWISSYVLPNEPIFDRETTTELARAAISGLIWIPYMLLSKRVKATFVERMPNTAPPADNEYIRM